MAARAVVVVGGGVAGLAAACRLAAEHEVLLLEADQVAGGKLRTAELLGRPLDLGPDSFITRDPTALELCRSLGLEDELLAPAGSGAAVWARGRLRPLPAGLALGVPTDLRSLRRSGIVSPLAVARAAADLVLPGPALPADLAAAALLGGPDPTVAQVVAPRLGRAVLESLVDPLLGGINASDVAALSFLAAAPALAERAAGRRSLLRALRPPARAPGPTLPPLFLGLRDGIARLGEALVSRARSQGAELRCGCAARELRPGPGGWVVRTEAGEELADGVVLAVPAYEAAALLRAASGPLADDLAAVPYAGVATCTFAWPETAVPGEVGEALAGLRAAGLPSGPGGLAGNGVLVPRSSGMLVTAATFTSTKWPRSAAPGRVVVRASVGRHGDGRALALDDATLRQQVLGELAQLLGLRGEPEAGQLQRWPRSFPQYVSGHRALVARMAGRASELAPLALAGAAYEGIGIPACVASGQEAAEVLAAALARPARAGS